MALYVVVVLYNCRIDESPACISLLNQDCPVAADSILVYDNSEHSKIKSTPKGWELHSDPTNGGLSSAYNFAIQRAKSLGFTWVLLLDQDTVLPPNYLVGVRAKLLEMCSYPTVVAVVPIIKVGNRQMSPMSPRLGREIPFRLRNVAVSEWLAAINSGNCVRIDFVDEIGGFCKDFPLDYLDFWFFKMVGDKGKSVYVDSVELQHDLSVANMNQMSLERYKRILAAELRFTNGYLPLTWRLLVVPRLIGRAVKHFLQTSNKRLALSMVSAAITQVSYLCGFRHTGQMHETRE